MSVREKINLKNPVVVCILATIACLLWGSAFPCVKIGYDLFSIDTSHTPSVLLFAGLRFTLAGFLVIVFGSTIKKKVLLPRKTSWGKIGLLCLTQTVLQYAFFYIGLANTTGVKASVAEATNVFIAILIAAFVFRLEKFTLFKALGCLVGFAGVILINADGLNFNFSFLGEGFILISTLSYAFSAALLKIFAQREDTFVLSGYQFFFGGVILSVAGACFGGKIPAFSFPALAMLFYLALISSVAYTLWGSLLKYNPPSAVAAYGFMNPVFGVILSALFLREEIDPIVCVCSLLLISGGILLINLLGNRSGLRNQSESE